MPNAKISQWPTPWSLEPNARRNFVDANGKYIGCCSVDDASALVVEAVNEYAGRENWRVDEKTGLVYCGTTIGEGEARQTIEEARASIGEEAR